MVVKQTFRKIAFLEYIPGKKHREKDDENVVVSVNTKFGMISFGHKCLAKLGMSDQLVKLFYEPTTKKIGWRIYNGSSVEHSKMKGIKLVRANPTTGIYKMSITKMLKDMKGLDESYKNLTVKKYVDTDILNRGDTYYYVQLKQKDEQIDGEED